ncbi:MAG: hypothetical protein AAF250_03605 [Pseudomonadota bacterium]
MKTLTSMIIAAALIAPHAASAQRHTTPNTQERHAVNLAETNSKDASSERRADNERKDAERDTRVTAAKAGKINVAAPADG